MNWTFVLVGNLIMDSAIALFVLLSGLEIIYQKKATEKNISQILFDIRKNLCNS